MNRSRSSGQRLTDHDIERVIDALESEREQLRSREPGEAGDAREAGVARLEVIRVDIDRLWDLLRQRRALRDAGEDPRGAHERSAGVVERYWQ